MRTLLLALLTATIASPAFAAAIAAPEENPAKGTKNCLVWDPLSEVFAQVYADGGVGLTVDADTAPRSQIYFMIDGKRYAGRADHFLSVDVGPLLEDSPIDYSYSHWPSNAEIIEKVTIVDFAKAYDDCVKFLAK
jgi:hypothetical protein